MIAAFVFLLGAVPADAGTSGKSAAPVAIGDLWSADQAAGKGWSGELPGNERCRVYNCGLPRISIEELLKRSDPPRRRQDEK